MSNNTVLSQFGTPNGAADAGGGTITIPDFSDVEVKVHYAPPGQYPAKVTGFKQDVSRAGGAMLVFEFDVTTPSGVINGRRFHCPLSTNVLWKLKRTCGALGISPGAIKVSEVMGKQCMVNIVDDGHDVNDPAKKYCAVHSCDPMPAGGAPPSGSGPSLPAPPDDDLPF